jgi:hypothetical protein
MVVEDDAGILTKPKHCAEEQAIALKKTLGD